MHPLYGCGVVSCCGLSFPLLEYGWYVLVRENFGSQESSIEPMSFFGRRSLNLSRNLTVAGAKRTSKSLPGAPAESTIASRQSDGETTCVHHRLVVFFGLRFGAPGCRPQRPRRFLGRDFRGKRSSAPRGPPAGPGPLGLCGRDRSPDRVSSRRRRWNI